MYFAENLKYLRERKQETQRELGAFLQVGKSTVCHYELGNSEPSLKHIIAISEHYDISVDDLLKTKLKVKVMFSKNLKYLRQKRGLHQEELANCLCIAQSSVANYEVERREPDLKTIIEIARFFDITLDTLLVEDIKEANK